VQWDRGHESDNVRDERGRSAVPSGANLGILWLGFRIASQFGLPGIAVFVAILLCVGVVTATSGVLGGGGVGTHAVSGAEDEQVHFVSFVLDDVQKMWTEKLAARGVTYHPTQLVLYRGGYNTGCGYGSAASGPFYCPADHQVYLDLSFLQELDQRFGAPGDFAVAYVLAHEVGHHVQYELGLDRGVSMREGANGGSVRFELQADCFAGIWAGTTAARGILDPGDAEEALQAASSVGDDRLEQQATGRIAPDTFTHGTSAQRKGWFEQGYRHGTIEACDTQKSVNP
jgi:predicted metalloprotease